MPPKVATLDDYEEKPLPSNPERATSLHKTRPRRLKKK